MRLAVFALAASSLVAAPRQSVPETTFTKQVAPILQNRCEGCHRPGEAAPVSFLTYKEVRPWAKAIREAVLARRMPPWFADPHVGRFANDRSLSREEIDTIVRWVDGGAREGNPRDLPPAKAHVEGWNIGHPDMVVEMPSDYLVPAKGTVEYTYFVVPTGFTEDRWVTASEVRPGNRRVVHHVIAFVREPGSKWLKDARPGEAFVPKKGDSNGGNNGGQFLSGYAPGTIPDVLAPGQARLVKAGSDIVLQMHYTAAGAEQKDRTRVGLKFATEPPARRVLTLAARDQKFVIPAGAPNYRVDASFTMNADAEIVSFLPHMHLRGKSFDYRIVYPDGRSEHVLSVPRYDFNWQLVYHPMKPIALPKGTRVDCTAHFDNSPNNPHNPDPTVEVRWGEQSWEEMMFGFFNVAFDAKMNPGELFPPRKKTEGAD